MPAEEVHNLYYLVGGTIGAIVALKFTFNIVKNGFKRDTVKSSFTNPFVALSNLLSNEDSVLGRESVDSSIKGYEKLFDGMYLQLES